MHQVETVGQICAEQSDITALVFSHPRSLFHFQQLAEYECILYLTSLAQFPLTTYPMTFSIPGAMSGIVPQERLALARAESFYSRHGHNR
jgi:hypothetical protein